MQLSGMLQSLVLFENIILTKRLHIEIYFVSLGQRLKVVVGAGAGAGDTGVGLVAASKAFILASGSLPASIIPDSVPVKNVAIGIISSKNF